MQKGRFKAGFKILSPNTHLRLMRGFLPGKVVGELWFSLFSPYQYGREKSGVFPSPRVHLRGSLKEPSLFWELGIYSLELEGTGIWFIPEEGKEERLWLEMICQMAAKTAERGIQIQSKLQLLSGRAEIGAPQLDVTGRRDLVPCSC